MTTTLGQPAPETDHADTSNASSTTWTPSGATPTRRAAHAKGVVLTGTFSASPEAASVTRAPHLNAGRVPVVARFSASFPGGLSHPDAAPESNPRGLAVQFRLGDGSTTDLLAHSINGFPGTVVEDFVDFLAAIAPGGPRPGAVPRHARRSRRVRARHPDPRRTGQLRHPQLLARQRVPLPGSRRHRDQRPLRLDPGRRPPRPRGQRGGGDVRRFPHRGGSWHAIGRRRVRSFWNSRSPSPATSPTTRTPSGPTNRRCASSSGPCT